MYHFHANNDNSGEHFGISHNTEGSVLVQLGDKSGDQVRILVSPADARFMAERLLEMAQQAEEELKDRHLMYFFEEANTNNLAKNKYIKSLNPATFTYEQEEAKIFINWQELRCGLFKIKAENPNIPIPKIYTFKETKEVSEKYPYPLKGYIKKV